MKPRPFHSLRLRSAPPGASPPLLHDDARTHVCVLSPVQEELPAQEKLKLSGKNGFLPYKPTADLIRRALDG